LRSLFSTDLPPPLDDDSHLRDDDHIFEPVSVVVAVSIRAT
jgi:hypothetical protein